MKTFTNIETIGYTGYEGAYSELLVRPLSML